MISEASLLSSVKVGLESLKQTVNSRGGLKSKAVDRYDKEISGRIVLDIGCEKRFAAQTWKFQAAHQETSASELRVCLGRNECSLKHTREPG